MANPIDTAKTLLDLLGRVRDDIAMAPKWRTEVEQMAQATEDIVRRLGHIHENIVPLDLADGVTQHVQNAEFFRSLPGGRVTKGSPEYERLLTQSATLRELYQAGFDIPDLTKFSDEELKLAGELGSNFRDWHEPWSGFRNSLQHGDSYRMPPARFARQWANFLGALRRWNVISEWDSFFKDFKKNEFVAVPVNRLAHMHANQQTRFEWTKQAGDYDELIKGNWFSAFAYAIVSDHLERLNTDYEIYTLVRYSAPPEVIRSAGDLDVVARAGSKILMIECKSGSLKEADRRNDFSSIIEKAEALRRVFVQAGSEIKDYEFWLIYNPYADGAEAVPQRLEGSGIVPVRPEDIRGFVRRTFSATR